MPAFVRALVMCLVALSIPVQGLAAIVMPMCLPAADMPGSLSLLPAAGHDAALAPAHFASAHAGHHGAGAAQAGPQASHADASHAGASDAGADPAGHSMLKCCSTVCSMAALSSPTPVGRLQARSPAPLPPVAQHYRGVTPDGLDRPPKLALA